MVPRCSSAFFVPCWWHSINSTPNLSLSVPSLPPVFKHHLCHHLNAYYLLNINPQSPTYLSSPSLLYSSLPSLICTSSHNQLLERKAWDSRIVFSYLQKVPACRLLPCHLNYVPVFSFGCSLRPSVRSFVRSFLSSKAINIISESICIVIYMQGYAST